MLSNQSQSHPNLNMSIFSIFSVNCCMTHLMFFNLTKLFLSRPQIILLAPAPSFAQADKSSVNGKYSLIYHVPTGHPTSSLVVPTAQLLTFVSVPRRVRESYRPQLVRAKHAQYADALRATLFADTTALVCFY